MPERGLTVRGMRVDFGSATILTDVSLAVGVGEIVGLVGPNGAGKTTTLRAISGLVRRRADEARIGDRDLPSSPSRTVAAGIVHVPEGRGLIASLSVRDNLRLACAAVGANLDPGVLESIVAVFPALGAILDRHAGLLSGGEAQMVAISRGIAVRPRVLMVDELSLGLAPKIIADLLGSLVEYGREHQVGLLLVDQNVRGLESACDRIYSLRQGATSVLDREGGSDALRSIYFDT